MEINVKKLQLKSENFHQSFDGISYASDLRGLLSFHGKFFPSCQCCQIFLCKTYQNGGKYIKRTQNIPNDHKIYQMAAKQTKGP
jgi:hypothetical protein